MTVGTIARMAAAGSGAAPAFSPSDITGLRYWLKADAIVGKVDGDAISQWNDSSGNGNHFAEATVVNQPAYKTNIVNSLPVVRFTPGGLGYDNLSRTSTADASFTFVIVGKKRSAPGGSVETLWSAAGSGNFNQFYTASGTHATAYNWFGDTGGSPVNITTSTATSWNVIVGKIASAASMSIYVNGGAPHTFNPHDEIVSDTLRTIGAQDADGANGGDYDIAEVLEYDTALADGDRDNLEIHLGAKYGITVA